MFVNPQHSGIYEPAGVASIHILVTRQHLDQSRAVTISRDLNETKKELSIKIWHTPATLRDPFLLKWVESELGETKGFVPVFVLCICVQCEY